ncbi:alpha-amylase family glycosyl hydrolase [Parasediminibacterium sp. JCM 36343]|uniref:alpha-amylase family glycosyl hydrolase n=1 Tax=Parasediminibacterium sp. JCM 36343 TaxID=3374279 RepID=UPI00397A99ED
MKKYLLLTLLTTYHSLLTYAQYAKVEPTNWWVGMKWNKVQLLIKGDYEGFSKEKITINYPGVSIVKINQLDNSKYISVDISISPAALPGDVPIEFSKDGKSHTVKWPLEARRKGKGTTYAQGVTSSDFIYFLMPDRFSNGDESNDKVSGMRDQSLNRDSIYLRHGGDFQGIINHLDYIQSLGATTLWMTPVLENDMPNRTEHGYAFTDHYAIDPRYGGAKMYKALSDSLHKRGMKLIQDAVYNHVGSYHFTFLNQPTKDWFHQWPTYTGTSFKDQPLFDPHGSKKDAKITSDGWFTREMPDLNQGNPYVANYLIQHAIWSVEEFGVDGWRIDTYIYNDLPFMNRCNKALTDEYPKMTMFGETWVNGVINQSYFVENNLNVPFKSNLQAPVDFQVLFSGIQPAMVEKFGWNDGVSKLYTTLAQDIMYKDPMRNVIFLDNHDMTRFFSYVKEDVAKQKMGLGWLFTCRGIPQMYYGTEILMKGESNPDGWVRLDFAGGWKGDKKSAFTDEGLTQDQKDVQALVKTLGNFRKQSSAIKTGKLMQYLPKDGLYVYFRYDAKQTIMCIMNTSDKEQTVNLNDFTERTSGFTKATDIVSGNTITSNQFTIPAQKMWILELGK